MSVLNVKELGSEYIVVNLLRPLRTACYSNRCLPNTTIFWLLQRLLALVLSSRVFHANG